MIKHHLDKVNELRQEEVRRIERHHHNNDNLQQIKSNQDIDYDQFQSDINPNQSDQHQEQNILKTEELTVDEICVEKNPLTATTTRLTNDHNHDTMVNNNHSMLLSDGNNSIQQNNSFDNIKPLILGNLIDSSDEMKNYRCTNFCPKLWNSVKNEMEFPMNINPPIPIANNSIENNHNSDNNDYEFTRSNICNLCNVTEQLWSLSSSTSTSTSTSSSSEPLAIESSSSLSDRLEDKQTTFSQSFELINLHCTSCHHCIHDKLFLCMDNKYWHLNCLRCYKCGITLQWEKTCFVKNDMVFCREHYKRLSSCFRCGIKLNKNDLIFQVNYDTLYHESCFTCYTCGRLLKYGDTYILENQTIQCSSHTTTTTTTTNLTTNNDQSFMINKTSNDTNHSYIHSTIKQSNINNQFPNLINFLQSPNSINFNEENNNFHENLKKITKNFSSHSLTPPSYDYQQQNDLSIIYETTTTNNNSSNNNNDKFSSNDENNQQKNEKNSMNNIIMNYSTEQLTPLLVTNSLLLEKNKLINLTNHIDDCQNYLIKSHNQDDNESLSDCSKIPMKNFAYHEKDLNKLTHTQFCLIDTNPNYITDYVISNTKLSTINYNESMEIKEITETDNTRINLLPSIETVTQSFNTKSNIIIDSLNNDIHTNCILNTISTRTPISTVLTSPLYSFCSPSSSSSSSPSLSSICISLSTSPPLCPIGNFTNVSSISKTGLSTNKDVHNVITLNDTSQNHIINKRELPMLTDLCETPTNNKQQQPPLNETMTNEVVNKTSVKSVNLFKNTKSDQFKSTKSIKFIKKLDNERLITNEKLHRRMDKSTGKIKRIRTSFKHQQLRIMKSYFEFSHNPDSKDLKQLSQKTGLSKRVLQVWFQNARAKFRRNTNNQIYTDRLKQKEINSINQYSTSSPLPPPISTSTTQNINNNPNIINKSLYPCLTEYDYKDEEKIDNFYIKSINSDYNHYLNVSLNSNNESIINNNNLIQSNNIQSNLIICTTNNITSYTDNLSQSVR
uniref:Lim homeobox protein n=1 Tax=Schistosoma mansoni TaxID=6183 RepID=A0A3Q0KBL9_SCHMA